MARTVSAAVTRTTTGKHPLFTVPPKNTGLWNMMFISSTVGTESPKVYWYDSSTSTEYTILQGKNLGVGEYILLSDAVVALQENDQIRVENAGTNALTYVATIELRPAEAIQFHA